MLKKIETFYFEIFRSSDDRLSIPEKKIIFHPSEPLGAQSSEGLRGARRGPEGLGGARRGSGVLGETQRGSVGMAAQKWPAL